VIVRFCPKIGHTHKMFCELTKCR